MSKCVKYVEFSKIAISVTSYMPSTSMSIVNLKDIVLPVMLEGDTFNYSGLIADLTSQLRKSLPTCVKELEFYHYTEHETFLGVYNWFKNATINIILEASKTMTASEYIKTFENGSPNVKFFNPIEIIKKIAKEQYFNIHYSIGSSKVNIIKRKDKNKLFLSTVTLDAPNSTLAPLTIKVITLQDNYDTIKKAVLTALNERCDKIITGWLSDIITMSQDLTDAKAAYIRQIEDIQFVNNTMIAEADIIESTTTEINTYKINDISANEMACVIKKSFSNSNRLAIIECSEQYHKSLKNAHPEGITY